MRGGAKRSDTADRNWADRDLDRILLDIFSDFPRSLNERVEAARRQLDGWLGEHGLIKGETAWRRIARADLSQFAALTFPNAEEHTLCLAVDWFAWLILLDDHLDDGELGLDTDRVGGLVQGIMEILGQVGKNSPGSMRSRGDPAILAAFAELSERTYSLATERWYHRFVEHVANSGRAAFWEAENRIRGIIPDERTYITNRRHTGAVLVCLDLIEIMDHIDLPNPLYFGVPVQRCLLAACDVICWTNDLYSLEKEAALGEHHNLVSIIEHADGLPRGEAISRTVQKIADRIAVYKTAERAAIDDFREHNDALIKYFAGLRAWMRGNLEWSATTARFHPAEDMRSKSGDYLEEDVIGE
jgi:hypothetical protein